MRRIEGNLPETVVLLPTLWLGASHHHRLFPGALSLSEGLYGQVIQSVLDCIMESSVCAPGRVRRILLLNGHGGNIAPTSTAFSEIYAAASLDPSGTVPRLRCILRNWFDGEEVARLSREFYGDRLGTHATAAEVAMTQHLHPEAIKRVAMPPVVPTRRRFTDALDLRELHPDGRIGSEPGLATPEHGRALYEAAVRECAAAWTAFMDEA